MAWKTHEFQFDKQPLKVVFQTLAEVYHFNYQIDNQSLNKRTLTANFNERPIEEILQTISLSADVQITLNNRTYIIK
jgi:transmembrane sensor